ncbi:hypothetical protein VT84_36330 [Gemmata sp. SH-PL17]|uniref:hypothetical protein n=1 Tax=Gemmata sp. SH-PL17 TaxID=1630693 RepID=UPI0004B1304C|nr:hypothetical protein [Gemmata sp. SH-PL17]AMV29919.1 hypothetical protein VT84_36330 [Gemmata sp. SH-PL17]
MRTTPITAVFGLLLVTTFAVGGKERYYDSGSPASMPMVADRPGDAAVEQMIKDLGAEDWRTREQAGRDLTAQGERALPYMRRVLLATDNPEVQRRLAVLVKKLDFDRLVAPKLVTLSAKDRSAQDVVADIARQTGYKIDTSNMQMNTKHSFEFNDTPFWKAIDAVATACGCNVYTEYQDDTIRLYNQDSVSPYVAYAGPFRFTATNINCNRSVQLSNLSRRGGGDRVTEYMSLSFQVQSEPKNPMLSISQPELTVATDNLGGSMLPPRENNNYAYRSGYYNQGNRSHNHSMSVNLTRVDRGATSIKELKGRVRVELLSGTSPEVTVADPLKVKKKTFTGRTADLEVTTVDADANNKGVYTVNVTAKNRAPVDPRRGDDYMWANNLQQRIELSDENGNKYFSYGMQSSSYTPGGYQMTLMFGPDDRRTGRPAPFKLGAPTRLVLTEWHTVTHEVTFEFKNVPLP